MDIRELTITTGGRVTEISNPTREEIDKWLITIVRNWIGDIQVESGDGWYLMLYVENGRFSLSIVESDRAVYYMVDSSKENDVEAAIAGEMVPTYRILKDQNLVKECVLYFYETGRPYPGATYRENRRPR